MTLVFNIETNNEYLYDTSPEEAVELAFKQFSKKDWNTWSYKNKKEEIKRTKNTVYCGNFIALTHKPSFKEIYKQGELF